VRKQKQPGWDAKAHRKKRKLERLKPGSMVDSIKLEEPGVLLVE
jgi:hypothetical protein